MPYVYFPFSVSYIPLASMHFVAVQRLNCVQCDGGCEASDLHTDFACCLNILLLSVYKKFWQKGFVFTIVLAL